ncbi:MFS monocarboxylate transporter [Cordyceps javanica]|uniref:MFS monocarboxylate transporter n=1 Tax=Cordyceps javanica TaxID=43265 RepID=A0A545US46_9HYPO|nr:MFS monocarboxylate transporter [Cordyceps javanica]
MDSAVTTTEALPMDATKPTGSLILPDRSPSLQPDLSLTEKLQKLSIQSAYSVNGQHLALWSATAENEVRLLRHMQGNLSWDKLEHEDIDLNFGISRYCPLQAKNAFLNGRQRTVIQVAAVAEDVKLKNTLAKLCEKLSSAFGVIPLQDTQMTINQKVIDGKDASTRTAQQYLVVLDTSDKRLVRALPDVGQKVQIRFKLNYHSSYIPAVKISDTDTADAAEYIHDLFQGSMMSDTEQFLSQFNKSEEDNAQDPVENVQAALDFLSDDSRDLVDTIEKTKTWVEANPWFRFSPRGTKWTDVEWPGTRIKPPPGVRSSRAFFKVSTPWQPLWPDFVRVANVRVKFPLPAQHDNLHKTIESMALTIGGRLTYSPDIKVQWFEGKAHKVLNQSGNTEPVKAWWEYTLNFQTFDPKYYRNLHKVFPAIADHMQAGKFQGEHAVVAQALTKTKAGKFIISGCPGSGKSTFCQRIASAVVDKHCEPEAGYEKGRPKADRSGSVRAKVIYTSPQNEQCRDAINRFKLLNPGRKACRVYGYNRELQALIQDECKVGTSQSAETKDEPINKFHKALNQHTRRSEVEHEDPRDPRLDCDSLSSIIRATAPEENLEKLRESWRLWKNAKQTWYRKEEEFKKEGAKLLKWAVDGADALFDKGVLGKPNLLIIDEVGRLTETHALIGFSIWKDVPIIFAGDHEQLGPIVDTTDTRFHYTVEEKESEFRSLVGAQLEKSLLERAAALGGVDAQLRSNHRVYGSAGEFPCEVLYKGRMIQTHTDESPATIAVGEWFARHSQSRKNALFVDLHSEEQEQGTSKINPTSAYFVVQLAVDIAREMKLPLMDDYKKFDNPLENKDSIRKGRILILVAYAPQKVQVLSCLKKISAHEVDKSRISVRTIDDSPSHEAEIAIVDLVRTGRIGFLAEPARLKVAATRAQLGTIWVSNREICQRRESHNLKKLYDYHKAHNAVISIRGYDTVCEKCCRAGHVEHRCAEKNLRCNVCDKNSRQTDQHAARNCRHTTWPTRADWEGERWMSSPKSVDSVIRDPFVTK